MKKILALVLTLALALSVSACAFAEYTPSGEFNIRVFAKAGGVADIISRIAAQGLQEQYGVTAIVNNLTGRGGHERLRPLHQRTLRRVHESVHHGSTDESRTQHPL